MYGMVNKAVEDLVCLKFGEDKWEAIKDRAGVNEDLFISNESYPDELTYRLVGAASEILELPADKILHAFGEHWILNTAVEGYGDLMEAGGKSLAEFLENLPNFHTRVTLIFPKLQPPRFEVSERTDKSLKLHYHTHRAGLAPFVLGLLSGLAKRFETDVKITQVQNRADGADHDQFVIEW
jgi:hypothetical protein